MDPYSVFADVGWIVFDDIDSEGMSDALEEGNGDEDDDTDDDGRNEVDNTDFLEVDVSWTTLLSLASEFASSEKVELA